MMGSKWLNAWLVLAVIAIALLLGRGAVRLVAHARLDARKCSSLANLHSWGAPIQMYRHEEGRYPDTFQALIDAGYVECCCPSLIDPCDPQGEGPADETGRSSYQYVGAIPVDAPPEIIIAYLRPGIRSDERVVLYNDRERSVEWVCEEELHGGPEVGQRSLRASYDAVVAAFGDELTPGRDAELREFYEIED